MAAPWSFPCVPSLPSASARSSFLGSAQALVGLIRAKRSASPSKNRHPLVASAATAVSFALIQGPSARSARSRPSTLFGASAACAYRRIFESMKGSARRPCSRKTRVASGGVAAWLVEGHEAHPNLAWRRASNSAVTRRCAAAAPAQGVGAATVERISEQTIVGGNTAERRTSPFEALTTLRDRRGVAALSATGCQRTAHKAEQRLERARSCHRGLQTSLEGLLCRVFPRSSGASCARGQTMPARRRVAG